jgi:3-hydroxyisobutyrate dehydrogenase-like beta-hydroxyacid dehydrogenase
MSRAIGFIGLGLMGEGMAANLVKAGFDVTVYNRTLAKTKALKALGARVARSPAEAVTAGGIAITMVANDSVLEEVTTGPDGFGEKLGHKGIHLSMSTISPVTSEKLAKYHLARGCDYVAAPVFGRPTAAAAGKLWLCMSGPKAAKKKLAPVLQAMGQSVHDFGEAPGAANVVKLAGNFMIAALLETMGEAFALADKNGVSGKDAAAFFAETLFAAPVFRNYAPLIAARETKDVGFFLKLGLKDINLVLDASNRSQTPMPVANIVHRRLVSAMAKGRGDWDWTMLALGVAEDAGLMNKKKS